MRPAARAAVGVVAAAGDTGLADLVDEVAVVGELQQLVVAAAVAGDVDGVHVVDVDAGQVHLVGVDRAGLDDLVEQPGNELVATS